MLAKPRNRTDNSALGGEITKLLGTGKAPAVETILCTGRSRMMSTAEFVQEFTVKYEPPKLPGTFGAG